MSGSIDYWSGIALWLAAWAGAFGVSALATRLRLHGRTTGDLILAARDLAGAAIALCGWRALQSTTPMRLDSALPIPRALDWLLLAPAAALTIAYLYLVARRGPLRVETPAMYRQRHPFIPLRILTFVAFQQAAVTLLLYDWHRLHYPEPRALLQTAFVFGATHLGVAAFGLPLSQAAILTVASATAMLLWGTLRIEQHTILVPIFIHYLFYIGLACNEARKAAPVEPAPQ